MKKIIKKIIMFALVLFTSISLASCGKNEMEKFIDQTIGEKANYELTMKTNLLGIPIEVTMQVDGNVMRMDPFLTSSETYYEIKDGKEYVYSKVDGVWVRVENNDNNHENPMDDFEGLQAKDFEENNHVWRLKEEKLSQYEMSSLEVVFEKSKVTMKMVANEEGLFLKAECIFTNFGKVKLTLPTIA